MKLHVEGYGTPDFSDLTHKGILSFKPSPTSALDLTVNAWMATAVAHQAHASTSFLFGHALDVGQGATRRSRRLGWQRESSMIRSILRTGHHGADSWSLSRVCPPMRLMAHHSLPHPLGGCHWQAPHGRGDSRPDSVSREPLGSQYLNHWFRPRPQGEKDTRCYAFQTGRRLTIWQL